MKYFRLFSTLDSKVKGASPQVQDAVVPTTVNDKNYIGSYRFEQLPANIYLPKGILAPRAKMTDLVMASFIGFSLRLFVSRRLANILEQSQHFGMQFLNTTLIDRKGNEHPYVIVQTYDFGHEFIDYEQSSFIVTDDYMTMSNISSKHIHSAAEYDTWFERAGEPSEFLFVDKVSFFESLTMDFFAIRGMKDGMYYVSERLKNQIEAAGCTGILFRELNEPYFM
jgi:hypothetical protein